MNDYDFRSICERCEGDGIVIFGNPNYMKYPVKGLNYDDCYVCKGCGKIDDIPTVELEENNED